MKGGRKLRLEEELEEKSKNWSGWQWALAALSLAGVSYGAIRFIEWALK